MGDYSRFAMAGPGARRRASLETTAIATSATMMPARTSSQKWLPVAITENQTQAGQRAQNALKYHRLHAPKRLTPTTRASAAWRLGIAANGFAIAPTSPLEWLTPSTKPQEGNIHGGAVGTRM